MNQKDDQEPLSRALEAEYAAIFGYGIVSAYISGSRNNSVAKVWSAHRSRRNRLIAFMRHHGLAFPEPELAYASRKKVWDSLTAIQLAARIEEDCTVAWSQALQSCVSSDSRELAMRSLLNCVEWVARWRTAAGTTPVVDPLPGLIRLHKGDKREVSPGSSPAPETPVISTSQTSESEHSYENNDLSGYDYLNSPWNSYTDSATPEPIDTSSKASDSNTIESPNTSP